MAVTNRFYFCKFFDQNCPLTIGTIFFDETRQRLWGVILKWWEELGSEWEELKWILETEK